MKNPTSVFQNFILPVLLVFVCLMTRLIILRHYSFSLFNADQAVVGIMAKHILEGKWMVYFYGQGYMGSLEAMVAALFLLLPGYSIASVQLAPLFFYLLFIWIFYRFVCKLYGVWPALAGSLWLCFPSPELVKLSVTALGGYPETLFFGTLFISRILLGPSWGKCPRYWFWTAFGLGIGFWVNNLVLLFAVAFLFTALWQYSMKVPESLRTQFGDILVLKRFRLPIWVKRLCFAVHVSFALFLIWQTLAFLFGPKPFALGSLHWNWPHPPFQVKHLKPWILSLAVESLVIFILSRPWSEVWGEFKKSFPFLAGLTLGTSPVWIYSLIDVGGYRILHGSGMVYLTQMQHHAKIVLVNNLLTGAMGIQSVYSKALFPYHSGIVVTMLIWSAVFLVALKSRSQKDCLRPAAIFAISCFSLAALNIGACLFNELESVRYVTPFYFVLAAVLALAWFYAESIPKAFKFFILVILIITNIVSYPPFLNQMQPAEALTATDYQNLIKRLTSDNIRGAYADYWISYVITFMSKEEIIVAPFQSQDRYPDYTRFVGQQTKVAYIFLNETAAKAQSQALASNHEQTMIEQTGPFFLLLPRT